MIIEINGIKVEDTGSSWELRYKALKLKCYTFIVVGPEDVTRGALSKLLGQEIFGKVIKGVESFCVNDQYLKPISIAVDL